MYHWKMFKIGLPLVSSIFLLIGVLFSLQAEPLPQTEITPPETVDVPTQTGVSILKQDNDGLLIALNTAIINSTNDVYLLQHELNANIQEPGAPALPYYSTFIALPPEANVSITVTPIEVHTVNNVVIPAVEAPTLSFINYDEESPFPVTAVTPQVASDKTEQAIYPASTQFPNTIYQLSEPMYFRDIRLVKLDLFPLQYRPQQQEVTQTSQMLVNIQFHGAKFDNLQPAPSVHDIYHNSLAHKILNFEQGKAWRSLPSSMQATGDNKASASLVSLPAGATAYKIEIDQDGIYDITGQDLTSAGMAISNVNPDHIEFMSRGEPVAYEFIKNGANAGIIEANDIIRFYGEGVNGSRREKQFLTHNIYWLWSDPDGSSTSIDTLPNNPDADLATSFIDSITREDENYFFSTWTDQWEQFPNEPDSWYWAHLRSPTSQNYEIELPDPILEDTQATTYTVEVLTRESYVNEFNYSVEVCLNGTFGCVQTTWTGHQNVNIMNTVPMTSLVPGTNEFTINLSNSVAPDSRVRLFLNRITVEYLRSLKAVDDELFFTDAVGGRTMIVQDFSEGEPDNILVWDITTPLNPTQIALDYDDILENNGRYTYTIGIPNTTTTTQQYIATTVSNTLSPDHISQYQVPTTIEPVDGADWVAISYKDFLPQTQNLAEHRAQAAYGGMKTHVVDIEDVINLYYHGLAMPEAIHAFLENSLTWPTKPSYVVLMGDGVVSPRHLPCAAYCYSDWDVNAQNFVPTDIQFIDRYQGLTPTDSTYVFLVGDDLLADMAIGRLAAESISQAEAMVDKIIRYEENLLAKVPGYQRVLFIADNPDPDAGGNFCDTNLEQTGSLIPADYEQTHLCREDYANDVAFTETIKAETYPGAAILTYRGHGAIHAWGNSPRFWSADSSVSDEALKRTWANHLSQKPVAILSADCLDGYFALPGHSGLSERFMNLDEYAGAAAHWSSSGLGLDHEHTALLEGFYESLFGTEQIRLGDATNYAKLHFSLSANYAKSEMYSFNLQGDPAMQINVLDLSVFLPVIIR